jgi:YVTN family beta-propeller protein
MGVPGRLVEVGGGALRLGIRCAARLVVVVLVLVTLIGVSIGVFVAEPTRPGPLTVSVQRQASGHVAPGRLWSGHIVTGVSTVSVASGPVFDEIFTESGLPSGTSWNVSLAGHTQTAQAGESIEFTEPAGTYTYTLTGPPGLQPTGGAGAFTGTLLVPGSSNTEIPPGIGVWSEPIASAYDPTNGYLYVANDGSNSISVINASTDSLVIPQIGVGIEPGALAYDPSNGDLYVTEFFENFLTVIDTATNTVIIPVLPVGDAPDGIAYDAANGDVYVANWGTNNVTVISGATNTVIVPGIPAGTAPAGVAFDVANGDVYVTNSESNNVTVIDGSTDTVVGPGIPVGTEPYAVAYDPSNGFLYVANLEAQGVSVINGTSDSVVLPSLPVGSYPGGIAYDPSNGFLYVANSRGDSVSVIDGWTDTTVAQNVPVGDGPTGVAVDPDNGYVYVTCILSDNVTVLDGNGGVATTWEPDPEYSVSFTEAGLTSGAIWSVSLDGTTEHSPAGIAITFAEPNGSYLYKVNTTGSFSAVPGAGNATVTGSSVTVGITFNVVPAATSSGFLGLPDDTGYLVIAAILVIGVIAGVAGFLVGKGRSGGKSSTTPPPGAAP